MIDCGHIITKPLLEFAKTTWPVWLYDLMYAEDRNVYRWPCEYISYEITEGILEALEDEGPL